MITIKGPWCRPHIKAIPQAKATITYRHVSVSIPTTAAAIGNEGLS